MHYLSLRIQYIEYYWMLIKKCGRVVEIKWIAIFRSNQSVIITFEWGLRFVLHFLYLHLC